MDEQSGHDRTPSAETGDMEAAAPGGRLGRRALMIGGVAAGAGIAGGLIARPEPAEAASNPVLLGQSNTETETTSISNASSGGFSGITSANGGHSGVHGNDTSTKGGYGVAGNSVNGYGVAGGSQNGIGVSGTT